MDHDPSKNVVEAIILLQDLIKQINPHPEIAASVIVQEIRSILFFSFEDLHSKDLRFWFLPFSDHLALLTSVIIPLCREYGTDERVASQMLTNVLSCLNHKDSWPLSYSLSDNRSSSFFNSAIIPSASNSKQFTEFNMKLEGIILQFVGSLSSVAQTLEILNIASQGNLTLSFLQSIYLIPFSSSSSIKLCFGFSL